MRTIQMTDMLWNRILSMRAGRHSGRRRDAHPEVSLYGPIASARGRFVLAQVGQSLDGRVATPSGDARDISGPEGIAHLHRCRALVDAVIVGMGTVKNDDPRLSVRVVEGPSPTRVVIDCHGELQGDESLFNDGGAPVVVIQGSHVKTKNLRADIITFDRKETGICPHAILDALAKHGLHKILVEGGAKTIARFIDADLVDRLHVSISPLIIGSGPCGISLPPIAQLSNAHRPAAQIYGLRSDVLFDCDLKCAVPSGRGAQEDVRVTDNAMVAALADG